MTNAFVQLARRAADAISGPTKLLAKGNAAAVATSAEALAAAASLMQSSVLLSFGTSGFALATSTLAARAVELFTPTGAGIASLVKSRDLLRQNGFDDEIQRRTIEPALRAWSEALDAKTAPEWGLDVLASCLRASDDTDPDRKAVLESLASRHLAFADPGQPGLETRLLPMLRRLRGISQTPASGQRVSPVRPGPR